MNNILRERDHPRTCGEKSLVMRWMSRSMGSPPHMRGKVALLGIDPTGARITPAHAGKSRKQIFRRP